MVTTKKKAPVAAMTAKKKAPAKKKDHGTLSGFRKDYPYVTIGTHLTVIEYENGKTELKWDDEALLRDVRNAIASIK